MAVRKSMMIRFLVVCSLVIVGFLVVIYKMGYIMTVERTSWLALAEKTENRGKKEKKDVQPDRGNILSDDGSLITAAIPYYNVFMDLKVDPLLKKNGEFYKSNADSLSLCLSNMFKDRTKAEYKEMLDRGYVNRSRRWRIAPRRVTYLELLEMKTFPLLRENSNKGGFYYEKIPVRENLYGSLANRTVGAINMDGHGIFGLEQYYDKLLSGEKGIAQGHRSGRKLIYVSDKEALRGADIVTTLDLDIQEICETALREKLDLVKAKKACLVMMEVETGQIKSIVNLVRTSDGKYKEGPNMALTDLSEPGSTFKTMSMMIALDSNLCDTSDIYNINHGVWEFYDAEMKDHNWKRGGYDSLSVNQIFAYSSNVGVSRIIGENYKDKPQFYVDAVKNTKFAEKLDLKINGVARPKILEPGHPLWSGLSLPWMSIGYVVEVPPIYTLNFYNGIANGGKLMKPYLVKEVIQDDDVIESYHPEVINPSLCKESTLKKLKGMLEGVVEFGTARQIKSDVIKLAGKTGTSQLNYGKGQIVHHQLSFCGYFPADDPKYSCIVVVKEPQIPYSTAYIAGGVFKNVAERVYARKNKRNISDLEKWESDDKIAYNSPRVKGGDRKQVIKAMKQQNLDYEDNKSDWVVVKQGQNNLISEGRSMLDDIVPNVVGMGVADAVYLLEQRGLFVQIYGRGRVVKQSIKPGKKVEKGRTVTLELR